MRIFVLTKRTLMIIAFSILAIIAAIVIAVAFSRNMAPVSSLAVLEEYELEVLAGKKKELPVYCVQRDDKKVALTIDAAWEDDKTPFILETLDKYNIKATFFLCGFWVDKYPDNVKAIAAAGHEIGNHTNTHPHMNKLSNEQIKKELTDFEAKLKKLGIKQCSAFRAPYGEYNDNVIKAVRAMGYEVLQWNIDTIDWREERSSETILAAVLPKLTPGSIILSHNNGYKIKEYLPVLLEKAIAQGYEFVTIDELLLKGETIIDVNGLQRPK